MKTICPIMHLAVPIWEYEYAGYDREISDCHGPKCQWWPKCRQVNQCPLCGHACAKHSHNIWACPEHGKFDSWGDFIPTEDQA